MMAKMTLLFILLSTLSCNATVQISTREAACAEDSDKDECKDTDKETAATEVTPTPTETSAEESPTPDTTAPDAPSSFTSAEGDQQISLVWVSGGSSDEAGFVVVKRASSAITWTPTDGATYTLNEDLGSSQSVLYVGTNLTKLDSLLTNGTTYHYAIFAYDDAKNYSSGVTTSNTPTPNTPKFVEVATGLTHTCGLSSEGNVWCWGSDSNGRLGNGAAISANQASPSALDISAMTGEKAFIKIASGGFGSCALTSEGKAWCWGSDANKSLGNGAAETTAKTSPFAVDISGMTGEKAFVEITAGFYHVCALTSEGKVWCWGQGDNGQLGNGAYSNHEAPVAVVTTGMTGEKSFIKLSAGTYHTCGLTAEGKAWCWGDDAAGQLGHGGPATTPNVPVTVDTSGMTGEKSFTDIAAGSEHTCATTSEGKIWCWGDDTLGTLGNGAALTGTKTVPSPLDISSMSGEKVFTQLVHSCAVTSEAKVWCWGYDGGGVAGNGPALTGNQVSPTALDTSVMTGNVSFAKISSTGFSPHVCGITVEGKVWCWGSDASGKLGNGSSLTADQVSPSALDDTGLTANKTFIKVTAAEGHTCGLTSTGKAYCWGLDNNGRLGNGAITGTQNLPSAVDTSAMGGETSFIDLAAGQSTTCGITADGRGWCWGQDSSGRLGNGAAITTSQTAPSAIDTSTMSGEMAFVKITAGFNFACGLTSEGKVWCWGSDSSGDLGNGAGVTTAQHSPSALDISGMSGEKAFVEITAGSNFACGITAEGKVWCWGSDASLQLGNGAAITVNQVSPSALDISGMSGEKAFVKVALGDYFSCGLTTEGKIWCWGGEGSGQLGNGGGLGDSSASPVALDISGMSGEKAFTDLAIGIDQACAITAEGKAWCWGSDAGGMLGNGAAVSADQGSPSLVDTSGMSGEKAFVKISCNLGHTCAVTAQGKIWCWGSSILGDGAGSSTQYSPVAVDGSGI